MHDLALDAGAGLGRFTYWPSLVLCVQVKIHLSSVNCGLDMPPSTGRLRACPIVIFDEARHWVAPMLLTAAS